jgi:hypothetical protein
VLIIQLHWKAGSSGDTVGVISTALSMENIDNMHQINCPYSLNSFHAHVIMVT